MSGQNLWPSDYPSDTGGASNIKVAIPRLRREGDTLGSFGERRRASGSGASSLGDTKHRVAHACEPCRQRKTKCNGERPICQHCEQFKIGCYYGYGKRERTKNELKFLQDRIDIYEKTLQELCIDDYINPEGKDIALEALRDSAQWPQISQRIDVRDSPSTEAPATAKQGSKSFRLLDKVPDDFGGSGSHYPQGYLGQSSDLAWLRTIIQDEPPAGANEPVEGKGKEPNFSDEDKAESSDAAAARERLTREKSDSSNGIDAHVSYHLDDLNPYVPLPELLDSFTLPPRHIADLLVNSFFSTVHEAFPIIFRPQFMREYEACMRSQFLPQPPRTWLASLNVIFAIGALYSQVTNAPWKGDVRDHLTFLANAQRLFFNDGILFHNPDQRQVQALSLLGIYLLSTKQINRGWNVVGLAIRNAYSLGLHLSSDLTKLGRVDQEIRHRKWYTLISLERLCGILTGRPISIAESQYHLPLLSGISEYHLDDLMHHPDARGSHATDIEWQGLNADEFFVESIKLYRISMQILNKIYSAGTVNLSWREVENTIQNLGNELENWDEELSAGLHVDSGNQVSIEVKRKQIQLRLDYFNTRILLNRPCLCRTSVSESTQSREFNHSASKACVSAALGVVGLLPDDFNITQFWESFPWWIAVYYIVSSGMIILMEMIMHAEHLPNKKDDLFACAQKVIRILEHLGQIDLAARRSYDMMTDLMIVAAPRIGKDYQRISHTLEFQDDLDIPRTEAANFSYTELLQSQGVDYSMMTGTFAHPFDPSNQEDAHPLDNTENRSRAIQAMDVPGVSILAYTEFDPPGLLPGYALHSSARGQSRGTPNWHVPHISSAVVQEGLESYGGNNESSSGYFAESSQADHPMYDASLGEHSQVSNSEQSSKQFFQHPPPPQR